MKSLDSKGNLQKVLMVLGICLMMPIFLLAQAAKESVKPVNPSVPSMRARSFIPMTKDKKPVVAQKSVSNVEEEKTLVKENLSSWPVFRIGTRFTYVFLLDKRGDLEENKFCKDMSINYLKAVQQYLPIKIYARWMLMEDIGIEATWDRIEAEARTEGGGENYSDGNMSLTGPMLSFFKEFPLETESLSSRISLGVGFAYLFGDFEEADWWKYRVGATQTMEIDEEFAFLATADWRWNLIERWDIDIYLRYLRADAVDTFTIYYDDPDRKPQVRVGTFPLDNITFGIGISTAL